MRKLTTVFVGAIALALIGTTARANVLDPTNKLNKPAIKLRADVGKQVAKYTFCLVKAATSCEKGGANSHVECHLSTGVVDFEPTGGKYTTKFQAAIAKCDSKINLTKKDFTGGYTAIGCPGDCDSVAAGVQECSDLTAFQATVTSATSSSAPKGQLPTLSLLIDSACATDNPGVMPTDPIRIACVADNAKALTKYAQGLFKCEGKCENDVKGKIGNGGFDNGTSCAAGVSADMNFNACESAALTKAGALSPSVSANVVPVLRSVINSATQGLYDRADPTGTVADTPCGTCGNNLREGAEVCDGTSAAACPGMCKPDCTCP
jgi:hypothetical protein